jgi:hypothetical protein
MSCYILHMARGPSGRVIIEMEPTLKRALHARLVSEGRSLKDWFLECADAYLDPAQQTLPLELGEPPSPDYRPAERTKRKPTVRATSRQKVNN